MSRSAAMRTTAWRRAWKAAAAAMVAAGVCAGGSGCAGGEASREPAKTKVTDAQMGGAGGSGAAGDRGASGAEDAEGGAGDARGGLALGLPENLAFTADAIRALAANPGNWVFCPVGPLEVGAAIAAGGRGPTRSELQTALHLGDAGPVRTSLSRSDSLDLELATSMWISPTAKLLPEYVSGVREDFAAEIGKGFDEPSINAWVAERTHGRISKLLEPGTVTPETRLVLVNTAYFRGRWVTPFDTSATSPQPFHADGGSEVDAPTMSRTARFGYSETPARQVLTMDYQGDEFVFVCVLPREGTTPAQLASKWTADDVAALLDAPPAQQVEVHLPKFTMRWKSDLVPMFRALGVEKAFDAAQADFGAMSVDPLAVSFIVQESTIELDEAGTVATSATAGGMALTAMPVDPPAVFRADRPFLFLIVAPHAKCVLFAGVVANPLA